MPQDLQAILIEYEKVRDLYAELARTVAEQIQEAARAFGLRPTITHREKDTRSLIRKCMLYDGPLSKVTDKAGVKIVTRYESEAHQMEQVLKAANLEIIDRDVKAEGYGANELGYLGTHFQVKFIPEKVPENLLNLECEVIVHTGSEAVWDAIGHELMYKPLVHLPYQHKRRLHRLLALVELFDEGVSTVRDGYTTVENYRELRMLDTLEKYFFRLDPHEYRRDMSLRTIEALAGELDQNRINRFEDEIREFYDANVPALKAAFGQFNDPSDLRGIFLHQPETLLIFAMFSWNKRETVKRVWLRLFSRDSLEEIAALWGVTITPD